MLNYNELDKHTDKQDIEIAFYSVGCEAAMDSHTSLISNLIPDHQ